MKRIQPPHTEVSRMTRLYKQRGMTLISLLIVVSLLAVVALIVMKLFPLYNESFKVTSSLESVAGQSGVGSKSSAELQKLLLRSFEIQDVDQFNEYNLKKYLKVSKKKGTKDRDMTMKYEIRGPLFGDLDAVLKYDKTVAIGGK